MSNYIAAFNVLTCRKASVAVMVFFSPKCIVCVSDRVIVTGFKISVNCTLHVQWMCQTAEYDIISICDKYSNIIFFTETLYSRQEYFIDESVIGIEFMHESFQIKQFGFFLSH